MRNFIRRKCDLTDRPSGWPHTTGSMIPRTCVGSWPGTVHPQHLQGANHGIPRQHDHPRSRWNTTQAVDDIRAREAAHSSELAAQGHLLRLWRPPLGPGEWRSIGLFAAADGDQLEEVLASMPLRVWRTDEVTPLAPHPNDPAGHGPGRAAP